MGRLSPTEKDDIYATLPKEQPCAHCQKPLDQQRFGLQLRPVTSLHPEPYWALRSWCKDCRATRMRAVRDDPAYRRYETITMRQYMRTAEGRAAWRRYDAAHKEERREKARLHSRKIVHERHMREAHVISAAVAATYGTTAPALRDYTSKRTIMAAATGRRDDPDAAMFSAEARVVHIYCLRAIGRLTHAEIATHLEIDRATVYHHLETARAHYKYDMEMRAMIRDVRDRLGRYNGHHVSARGTVLARNPHKQRLCDIGGWRYHDGWRTGEEEDVS